MKTFINNLGPSFYTWLIGFSLVIFVLVAAILIFFNNPDQRASGLVASVNPAPGSSLTIGAMPNIVINFKQKPKKIYNISVTYKDMASNTPLVKTKTNIIYTNESIRVVFLEPTKPLASYTIIVTRALDSQVVFTGDFFTGDIVPTPAPTNNKNLIPFLPYNTTNYSLEYLSSQNTYIFHFIFDTNSTQSIDDQFNKSKKDAIDFIKSKGVDPNTLIIDWRNS